MNSNGKTCRMKCNGDEMMTRCEEWSAVAMDQRIDVQRSGERELQVSMMSKPLH